MRVPLDRPGRIEIPASEGMIARVEPVVAGYWGASVAARAGGDPVMVRLFPTGTLEGTLQLPAGAEPPGALRASFEAPSKVRRLGVPTPAGAVDCPVAGERWSCVLPEALLDLRLHAPGFASALLWEVPVEGGATSPGGMVALVPGAAIIGRIEVDDAADRLEEVEVEVRPEGAEWRDVHGTERLGALFRTTGVDERGYFQLRDLRPGFYRVEVRLAGRAPAVRVPVEVVEGRETDLGSPLVLLPPARVELHLDPTQAPDGERWTVILSTLDGQSDRHLARVDWTGYGRIDGLTPGTYRYRVTSRGSTWATGTLVVSADRTVREIVIAQVALEGLVRRGDEAVRARIIFGGTEEYPEEIEIFSDPEGRLTGSLPREGTWPVRFSLERGGAEQGLEPIEVARAPGENAAWIEIEVFDTRISGRVIDTNDRPVSGGLVVAFREEDEAARRTIAHLDDEGRFRLLGLGPGTWTLEAAVGSDGGRVVVELADEAAEEVEIRLEGTREIRGRVVSPRGPVAAARLYLVPDVERTYPLRPIKTGPLGEFRERLPAAATFVHLLVMAPGNAARVLPLSLPPGRDRVEGVEIPVGEIGGTLRVLPPATGIGGLVLERGAARIHLRLLDEWMGFHGTRPREGEPWVLPKMEAGPYRLCWRDRCDSGVLAPGGELVVSAPRPPDR
ncbi:MAG TPA: carboxypeptidase-like regulatory domain-containing protein [Thermoanaerobaculia bacterium]|nr:carboxypeptidase-like regulatory domain-containing protein [Thermoanaerobaculia bacterium]